jgi:hypothetical protein
MVCQIPGELAEKSCQILGELIGGSTNVTDSGSQWDPLFVNLGKFIRLGGQEPDGCRCLLISSVSVDFLSSSLVFHSVVPVEFLANLLQTYMLVYIFR